MTPHLGFAAEKVLVAVIVAFYLKDCLVLLRGDEALLVRGLLGRWRAGFGLRHYQLAGLNPYLCNPLLPFEPVVRLRWALSAHAAIGWPGHLPRVLRMLQPLVVFIALALFAALPAVLLGQRGTFAVLVVVAFLYVAIGTCVVLVVMHRQSLGLDGKACTVLSAEMLLCPPYAANLVRKLSLRLNPQGDFVVSAEQLLHPSRQRSMQMQCHAALTDRLQLVDEQSPAAAALLTAQQRFGKAVAHDDN